MKQQKLGAIICLGFATIAAAQNPVNTTGGSTNSIPVFTGNVTIGNSAITQLNGNIGIGTPNPQATLSVHGNYANTGAGGIILDASDNGNPLSLNYFLSINPYVVGDAKVGYQFKTFSLLRGEQYPLTFNNTGYVGVGSRSPFAPLTVTAPNVSIVPTADANNNSGLTVRGANANVRLQLGVDDNSFGPFGGWIQATYDNGQPGSGIEPLLLQPNGGNVGIGTPAPSRKLHIAGDVQIDGNLYFGSNPQAQGEAYAGVKCGGDYAESVDVTGDRAAYAPGDVLVLDTNNPGRVLNPLNRTQRL